MNFYLFQHVKIIKDFDDEFFGKLIGKEGVIVGIGHYFCASDFTKPVTINGYLVQIEGTEVACRAEELEPVVLQDEKKEELEYMCS